MKQPNLLPCPFCGERIKPLKLRDEENHVTWSIDHRHPDHRIYTCWCRTREVLTETWNRRYTGKRKWNSCGFVRQANDRRTK